MTQGTRSGRRKAGQPRCGLSVMMGLWLGLAVLMPAVVVWDLSPGYGEARAGEQAEKNGGGQKARMDRPEGFVDIAKTVTPVVVNITATLEMTDGHTPVPSQSFGKPGKGPEPSDMAKRQRGSGSGVIFTEDGYIITNNHVVAQSQDLLVTLPDGREFPATVVGADPETDLAVIKIEAADLPTIPWGDSSALAVGQYVLAVGNPFGLNSTVTQGIVSGLDRGGIGLARFEDFIQTDAAINPGNSGGALVNTKGELVGINTAIASQSGGYQGVGFAVPSSLAKPVIQELIQHGKLVRGYLGVGVQEMTSDLAQWFGLKGSVGALVTDVVPEGPGDQAGLKRGDVIVQYQGQTVTDGRMLLDQVTRAPIGQRVELGIIDNGKKRKMEAVIHEQPAPPPARRAPRVQVDHPLAGMEVADIDESAIEVFGVDASTKGVVVSFMEEGCAARLAGILEGDIIIEINKHPIHSAKEYTAWYERLKKEEAILVVLLRASRHLYVPVKSFGKNG